MRPGDCLSVIPESTTAPTRAQPIPALVITGRMVALLHVALGPAADLLSSCTVDESWHWKKILPRPVKLQHFCVFKKRIKILLMPSCWNTAPPLAAARFGSAPRFPSAWPSPPTRRGAVPTELLASSWELPEGGNPTTSQGDALIHVSVSASSTRWSRCRSAHAAGPEAGAAAWGQDSGPAPHAAPSHSSFHPNPNSCNSFPLFSASACLRCPLIGSLHLLHIVFWLRFFYYWNKTDDIQGLNKKRPQKWSSGWLSADLNSSPPLPSHHHTVSLWFPLPYRPPGFSAYHHRIHR